MAITLDGNLGITTPAETVQGALTTTGNTILGDASTDTLNVGNGGLVKDASGNVGIGQTPTSYGSTVRTVEAFIAGASAFTLVSAATASVKTEITSGESSLIGQVGTRTNHPLVLKTNDTEQARITTAGLLQFNSGYGSAATAYGCRAWVNFNGTGTVAIRASGNVSSITDGGVGIYTVNFTTAMVDANYCIVATGNYSSSSAWVATPSSATTPTTSGVTIRSADTGVFADLSYVNVSIFR